MPQSYSYDVFLSFSSKDKPVVRELAERLRADGLRVWFDEWEVRAGDLIGLKIEQGLEASRTLVLAMSANALAAEWVTLERHTAMFRDPTNAHRRFIPLRLDDAEIKDTLRQYKHVDWRQRSAEQYARLLDTCRTPAGSRGHTGQPPVVGRAPTRSRLGRVAWFASGAVALGFAISAWARPQWFGLAGMPVVGSLSMAGLTFTNKNAQGYEEHRHDQTGIVFVLLPKGEFWMGSAETEEDHPSDERWHKVTLTKPFLLSKYEVTNAQFRQFRPAHNSGNGYDGDDQPVVSVSWNDGRAFFEWTRPRLRFPTEAEWEYAARGGDGRVFPWGNEWPPPKNAGNYAENLRVDGHSGTSPVGRFDANPFGIHDLGGNAWEWCADYYAEYLTGDDPDPQGPILGDRRVLRGGSFYSDHRRHLRCAYRDGYIADTRDELHGLRLALAAGTR